MAKKINYKKIEWLGGNTCDFCHKEITDKLIDGATRMGPWATMCEECFSKYGVGLGTGFGQKYKRNRRKQFLKMEE